MNPREERLYLNLAEKEGWNIRKKLRYGRDDCPYEITAEGRVFPLCHPYRIHLTFYRDAQNGSEKYEHMKAAHDYLWPHLVATWHYWDERRLRAHCDGYKYIVMAGGAGCGKSSCAARIALLFFLSAPKENTCLISSTTLDSLESRIWGYVVKYLTESAIPLEETIKFLRGKPPKIRHIDSIDKIHGMFATAIREGQTERVLGTVIGRHPDRALMIVLDEATDINPSFVASFPNLRKNKSYQVWAIGNSNNRNDLHGSMATPKGGWSGIDPMRDYVWETTQEEGICLYFNPYDSPAIVEPDPEKKKKLGLFLATEESLAKDEEIYGKHTDAFYRFTLGFWRSDTLDKTMTTGQFLTEHEVEKGAEWSGFYPLKIVAGLDPAFGVGKKGCLLRLAVLGHTVGGLVALDFRREELLFRIELRVTEDDSAELQLAKQVIEILAKYNCGLADLAIDASGSGRALGTLIRLVHGGQENPIQIVSSGSFSAMKLKKDNPYVHVTGASDMWFKLKEFIQCNQIKGLDGATIAQLTSREIQKNSTGKVMLEKKSDYLTRMTAINPKLAHSPDEADAAVLAVQVAILRYGFMPGQKREAPMGAESREPWFQKAMIVQREWRAREVSETLGGARKIPLLPNFSGSIEDIPNPRNGFEG